MTAAAAPQSAPLSLPSHFWADLSTRDFAALQHSGQADQVVAVLPVAAVKKLLLFNGHGGQVSVMDIVARELRTRCDLIVYSASWFSLPLPEVVAGQFSAQEHRFGIHAGEIETSMMLHLAPGTVHMEHARDFRSTSQDRSERYAILGNGKSAKLGWQMQDYHPAGAVGNAAGATADKGQAVVDAAAGQLVALLQELVHLPLQTVRPETE